MSSTPIRAEAPEARTPRPGLDDEAARAVPSRRLRVDGAGVRIPLPSSRWIAALAWIALGGGFVLLWGGNLDLGPRAARLGMAASEGIGPLGQVYGGWDPALWPGRVGPSQLWAWGEGGRATAASVRWPEAIAVLTIGLILSRRLAAAAGPRAGILAALALFSSVGGIHRDAGTGLDLIAGMAVVGALDRILERGTDLVAGIWAALAVLAGGWPPLVLIALPIIVLGKPGRSLSLRLLAPPLGALAGWAAWTLREATTELLAAALALPLTQKPAWWLVPGVVVLALPWGPIAALAAWPSIRRGWNERTRAAVLGWLQLAAVAALGGTLLPGIAPTARVVALGGLAVTAAAVIDGLLAEGASRSARRTALGIVLGLSLAWALLAVPLGGYIAAAISYYRPVALLVAGLAVVALGVAIAACRTGRIAVALAALCLLAIDLKLGHGGIYVPEWNYQVGQGPWGRAIGQWVPPNWPLYVTHAWPDDLMFHTQRPVRQLAAPEILGFKPQDRPHYVLLQPSELDHWPRHAPPVERVRSFEDQHGRPRVLVRTRPGTAGP